MEDLRNKSLAELRKQYLDRNGPVPEPLLEALERDGRNGALQLARILRRRRLKNRRESLRLRSLLRYEYMLWRRGVLRIAGVDEAGVAPLAGPVVAAAVILPRNYRLCGLDDSKKILDEARREQLALRIKEEAVCWSVGQAEVEEIDRLNIYQAGLLAMRRALEGLAIQPEHLLIDARRIPHCPIPQLGIIHGDALSASIAAASIIAKTSRDGLMRRLDRIYPGYRLASHKGYPTPEHCRLLQEKGALPIHRRSFARVREAIGMDPVQDSLF